MHSGVVVPSQHKVIKNKQIVLFGCHFAIFLARKNNISIYKFIREKSNFYYYFYDIHLQRLRKENF